MIPYLLPAEKRDLSPATATCMVSPQPPDKSPDQLTPCFQPCNTLSIEPS